MINLIMFIENFGYCSTIIDLKKKIINVLNIMIQLKLIVVLYFKMLIIGNLNTDRSSVSFI